MDAGGVGLVAGGRLEMRLIGAHGREVSHAALREIF